MPLSIHSYLCRYIQLFSSDLVHYHAWRKRGGRADAVVDGASQCIHTYMHGCKPGNLLTCTPCQQLMSGKRKTVHSPSEPTTLWLIASYVVVKLASVITENCSARFSWSHVGRGCASPSLLLKREIIANAKHDRLQQLYMHIERKHFIMILSGITNATTSCTIHL